MLSEATLKDVIHGESLSRRDKVLLCLAVEGAGVRTVRQIRALAVAAGVREARNWNVSALLAGTAPRAIHTGRGWELSAAGKQAVSNLLGVAPSGAAAPQVSKLRGVVGKIKKPDSRAFVEEAVACHEEGHLRAAVVLSWVGAVSVLYDHVLSHALGGFNAEATRRNPKWRNATDADGLARMEEYEFLQVAERIGVVGKSVKQELEAALKLRNACGHPNSLKIGEAKAAAHVESLVLNVFQRFPT